MIAVIQAPNLLGLLEVPSLPTNLQAETSLCQGAILATRPSTREACPWTRHPSRGQKRQKYLPLLKFWIVERPRRIDKRRCLDVSSTTKILGMLLGS